MAIHILHRPPERVLTYPDGVGPWAIQSIEEAVGRAVDQVQAAYVFKKRALEQSLLWSILPGRTTDLRQAAACATGLDLAWLVVRAVSALDGIQRLAKRHTLVTDAIPEATRTTLQDIANRRGECTPKDLAEAERMEALYSAVHRTGANMERWSDLSEPPPPKGGWRAWRDDPEGPAAKQCREIFWGAYHLTDQGRALLVPMLAGVRQTFVPEAVSKRLQNLGAELQRFDRQVALGQVRFADPADGVRHP